MTQPEGAFRRAQRPLIGWVYVVMGVASLVFVILLAMPVLRAVNRWADGESVDWMGFAAIASVAAGALGPIIAQGAQWMHTRSAERREEIRAGGPAPAPFVPSPPSEPPTPEGGLVNQDAL
jgi:hypothetical protein